MNIAMPDRFDKNYCKRLNIVKFVSISTVAALIIIFIGVRVAHGQEREGVIPFSDQLRRIKEIKKVTKIEVKVDASLKGEPYRHRMVQGINFFQGVDYGSHRFLEEVGIGSFRYKYILNVFKDLNLEFDTKNPVGRFQKAMQEHTIKYMKLINEKGGKILVQIYGVPKWLSSNQDERMDTNALPVYAKYPPKDYAKWQELVRRSLMKLKERGIKVDYCEILGEPNYKSTWKGTPEELNRFYMKTAEAVKSIYPDCKVGGVAVGMIPNHRFPDEWVKGLLEYCKSNKVPFEFFTFHSYSPFLPMYLDYAMKYIRQRLSDFGYGNIEIHLTEWDIAGAHDIPLMKDTHFRASYIASSFIKMQRSGLDYQYLYSLYTPRETFFKRHTNKPFNGTFGIFTPELPDRKSMPKSAFNAFKVFGNLRGEVIPVEVKASEYRASFKWVSMNFKDYNAMAVRNHEKISVIGAYYLPVKVYGYRKAGFEVPEPDFNVRSNAVFTVTNIPFKKWTYNIYFIDKKHGNAYWGGNPELEIFESGKGQGQRFEKEIDVDIYSVVLIEIMNSEADQKK